MLNFLNQFVIEFTQWILETISNFGYAGIGFLMALESAAIPIPSEIIMPVAGYLASLGKFNLWLVALAGASGSLLGSWFTYWLGLYGGRPFFKKYGKYFLFSEKHLEEADKFFHKHGVRAVFWGRLVPVIRTYISLPAGIHKVNFASFSLYGFIGSFIWSLTLAWIGHKLGVEWKLIKIYLQPASIFILIILTFFVLRWLLTKKRL